MKQGQFEQLYRSVWTQFDDMLNSLEKPQTQKSDGNKAIDLKHFTQLYRQVCHIHSIAKARGYSSYLVDQLADLIVRGHQQLYQRKHNIRHAFIQFFLYEFPRLVRSEKKLIGLASLLLYLPALLLYLAAHWQPELVYTVVDPAQAHMFEEMYNPANRTIGEARDSETNWHMFGYYIANNIGVSFQTFASGLIYTVGSIFYLVLNGILFGAVAGHLSNIGYAETFFTFVIGHGSFELTAIVIAGGAGLKLGLSLLRPGNKSRINSLKYAASIAVRLIYGVITMLVIAAFIEAFWSSNNVLHSWQKYAVGIVLWGIVIAYFVLGGRLKK